MSKTNFDICHEFFYSGFNQEYMPRYLNVGYSDNKFYSYSTVIGAVVKNKAGESVLLISSNNMSVTTSKHLSYLYSASPYEKIFIPFEYGWACFGEFKAEHAAELFEKALNQLSKAKMSLAKNRDEFVRCFNNATVFSGSVYTLKFLKKFEKTYIQVTEHVDEIKAKQRKIDNENLKKAKNKLNKLLKTQSIEEIDEYRYSYTDPVLSALISRNKIRALKKDAKIELEYVKSLSYSEIETYESKNPYVREQLREILYMKLRADCNERWKFIENLPTEQLKNYVTDNRLLKHRIYDEIYNRTLKEYTIKLKESVSCFGYAKTLKNIENDSYKLNVFREVFCYLDGFAFAWLSDDGTFKTTKHITLDKNIGVVALRLWKHKKLHLGAHIGIYTVLKITDEYVKIGCHTIPTKNLKELCEILNIA